MRKHSLAAAIGMALLIHPASIASLLLASLVSLHDSCIAAQAKPSARVSAPSPRPTMDLQALRDDLDALKLNAARHESKQSEWHRDLGDAVAAEQRERQNTTDRIEDIEETVARELQLISWVTGGWIALVSIIFAALALVVAALGFSVFKVYRRLLKEEERAKAAAKKAEDAATGAADAHAAAVEASQHAQAFKSSVADALPKIRELPGLKDQELYGLVGHDARLLTPAQHQAYEGADTILELARTLGVGAGGDLNEFASAFVKLGQYWRAYSDLPRSLARFQSALTFDPSNLEASRGIGNTYQAAAVWLNYPVKYRDGLLRGAEERYELLLKRDDVQRDVLLRAKILYDRAWVRDELGQYAAAIKDFEASAAAVGNLNAYYNLACSCGKWLKEGGFAASGFSDGELRTKALEALARVRDDPRLWENALIDNDLKILDLPSALDNRTTAAPLE